MKKSKLKLITKILAIIIICLISFVGIYVQKQNRMENIIKGYDLTKDLSGYRQIMFELSDATEVLDKDGKLVGNTDSYDDATIKSNEYKKTDVAVNKAEDIKKENYEITKKIIEKRLSLMGVQDYTLSLEKATGKMYLQIPEDDNADYVVSNILELGSFEIKDSEDDTTYITSDNLKKVSRFYQQTENGNLVCVGIQLDKEGTSILKDLSTNKYVTIEETQEDNTAVEENVQENETKTDEAENEEQKQKEVDILINGHTFDTLSYDKPVQDGFIGYSIGQASTNQEELQESARTALTYVVLLESGELPLVYKVTENQFVTTDISDIVIRNTLITAGTISAILLVFMIVKNKLRGVLGVISYIGFVAIYLLLIRYTNVVISISGAISIAIVLVINYLLTMKLLSIKEDDNLYKQEYLKFIFKMIPLIIISVVFVFMKWIPLSSFGMLLFWGISLILLYNILITKNIVK